MDLLNYRCYNNLWTRVQTMCSSRLPSSEISRSGAFQSSPGPRPLIPQRRASAHRLVASNTANTALRSALSRISAVPRSEEHTSELQSLRHLVCRLLLEKKKK